MPASLWLINNLLFSYRPLLSQCYIQIKFPWPSLPCEEHFEGASPSCSYKIWHFLISDTNEGNFDWAKYVENSSLTAGKDKWSPILLLESLFKSLLEAERALKALPFLDPLPCFQMLLICWRISAYLPQTRRFMMGMCCKCCEIL